MHDVPEERQTWIKSIAVRLMIAGGKNVKRALIVSSNATVRINPHIKADWTIIAPLFRT
jgi:hypothetical protein